MTLKKKHSPLNSKPWFVPVLLVCSIFLGFGIWKSIFSSNSNSNVVKKKEIVFPEKIKKDEFETLYDQNEELSEEELEERKIVRKEKEKEVLQVYLKSQSEESEAIESLLSRYGLTLESILEFPEENKEDLTEEEITLLQKYQEQKRHINWGKKELVLYSEKFLKEDERVIRKRRRKIAENLKNVGGGVIAVLSDPYLPLPIFQEATRILIQSEDLNAFETLLYMFERETKSDRKQILIYPMVELGKSKALPAILKIIEGPETPEKKIALSLFTLAIESGCESVLKSALDSKTPEAVRLAHEGLLQLSSESEEAKKILDEAFKAGKISAVSIQD